MPWTDRTDPAGRLLTAVAVMAIAATTLIAFGEPARAKGPTSVTVSGPWMDGPVRLDGTEELVRLMEQTGLWYGTGALPDPLAERPTDAVGPALTLAWVSPGPSGRDRTIRQVLYVDATGGPIIHTPAQPALDGWGPGVVGWFTAPSGLRDTLAELGVSMPDTAQASPAGQLTRVPWYLGPVVVVVAVGLAWRFWPSQPVVAERRHDGARSVAHNAEMGRGGFGGAA